jgi:uncharacterized membrane protein
VRTGEALPLGERAADMLRGAMGSWPFIFGALAFLAVWMLTDGGGGDPAPWIALNLILSCVAALQGGVLLIAAKRADKISAELADHDYETNREALAVLHAVHAHMHGQDCRCWSAAEATIEGGSA